MNVTPLPTVDTTYYIADIEFDTDGDSALAQKLADEWGICEFKISDDSFDTEDELLELVQNHITEETGWCLNRLALTQEV